MIRPGAQFSTDNFRCFKITAVWGHYKGISESCTGFSFDFNVVTVILIVCSIYRLVVCWLIYTSLGYIFSLGIYYREFIWHLLLANTFLSI